MPWSSVHRGDYKQMRKHLTIALLEAEALEPRTQLAYARGEIPDVLPANMGLVRLLLERADQVTHNTLDILIVNYGEIYADVAYSDRKLADTA
jgi:hypothetical protein